VIPSARLPGNLEREEYRLFIVVLAINANQLGRESSKVPY